MLTADVCDQFAADVQVCSAPLRSFGANIAFSGTIATIRCLRDNGLIRETVKQPGVGRVLVVDAGGVLDCALVGGDLAAQAAKSGWTGIIVNGCVRDLAELKVLPLGVHALAVWPRRGTRAGSGESAVPVSFGDVTFIPGHWLCADLDGLVVMREAPK